MLVEGIDFFLEDLLLGVAPFLSDTVACHAWDGGLRLWNDLSTLDVEALQLAQRAAGAKELGDHSHFL